MKTSILAGIAVSVGCIVNLLVGGVPGAILFSMGLGAILRTNRDINWEFYRCFKYRCRNFSNSGRRKDYK